jgi:Ca2+-binding EF-hand superfamily protein
MLAVVQDGERRRDLAQNTELAQLFREMDADGSGGLDREEVGLLLGEER